MKTDWVTLEKFISEMAHDKAKQPINDCFKNILDGNDPSMFFVAGAQIIAGIVRNDDPQGIACMNGLLFGVTLAYVSKFDNAKLAIQGFLDWKTRERGENVVNYFQAKAGRKK